MALAEFTEGCSVEVEGLINLKELNGQVGKVIGEQNGRLLVRLSDGDRSIKPVNLKVVKEKRKREYVVNNNENDNKDSTASGNGNNVKRPQLDVGDVFNGHGHNTQPTEKQPFVGTDLQQQYQNQVAQTNMLQQLLVMQGVDPNMLAALMQQQQRQLASSQGQPQHFSSNSYSTHQNHYSYQQQQQHPQHHHHHHHHHQHHHHHHYHQHQHSQQHPNQRGNNKNRPRSYVQIEDNKPSGCVLLVVLRGNGSRFSVETMFWIFSQFGVVQKISMFSRDQNNQALIQFELPKEAALAMGYLNGRKLTDNYNNTAELAIMLSSHVQLTFPKPDERNKEFSHLNSELKDIAEADLEAVAVEKGWEMRDFLWGSPLPTGSGWLDPKQLEDSGQWKIPTTSGLGKVGDCILVTGLTSLNGNAISAEALWGVVGIYGKIIAVKLLQKREGYALVQYEDKCYADQAIDSLNNSVIGTMSLHVKASTNSNALNWRGSKSGLARFMCTASDRPPPEVFTDSSPPSQHLLMNDILPEDMDDARSLGSSLHVPEEISEPTPSSLLFTFASTEDAFLTCAELNGKASLPSGSVVKFSFQQAAPVAI
eukprot:TRINITY_DN1121_c3_g1_i1.p1 TRINITY_DN1121_c3_g1~~TRINITY_DN1121_c3_g1_i1.p1  ORF type:complete len:593 (+),score=129.26 TRINITY_DN1121_c3_g1_i1:38-1816(+)